MEGDDYLLIDAGFHIPNISRIEDWAGIVEALWTEESEWSKEPVKISE